MVSLERAANFLQLSLRALWQPVTFGVRAFVENEAGEVALVRHSYAGGWHLPGGGVDRHERPDLAAVREAREEIGLKTSMPPEFFGLYSQRVGWIDNVIALYRLRGAAIVFEKSLEIREMQWADIARPPQGTTLATARRLAEHSGKVAISPIW